MSKLLNDIFSMSFDIVIPLSSCIVALMLADVLFCIRYFSYRRNKRKYEKKLQQEADSVTAVNDNDHTSGETFGS